jgi:hypothetical protein
MRLCVATVMLHKPLQALDWKLQAPFELQFKVTGAQLTMQLHCSESPATGGDVIFRQSRPLGIFSHWRTKQK